MLSISMVFKFNFKANFLSLISFTTSIEKVSEKKVKLKDLKVSTNSLKRHKECAFS